MYSSIDKNGRCLVVNNLDLYITSICFKVVKLKKKKLIGGYSKEDNFKKFSAQRSSNVPDFL